MESRGQSKLCEAGIYINGVIMHQNDLRGASALSRQAICSGVLLMRTLLKIHRLSSSYICFLLSATGSVSREYEADRCGVPNSANWLAGQKLVASATVQMTTRP